MNYRLAPAVVVRAACFPVSAVTDLADRELAACAAALDPDANADRDAWTRYEAAYALSIEAQRARLYAVTVRDPKFSRALTVTNPELAERLAPMGVHRRRDKRTRHHETTLYRYLARAVARTEPCDLWAGTTLARWGERTEAIPTEGSCALSPDLRPFQALLGELRRRPRYRRAGLWKANVTLCPRGDSTWRYWARDGSARFVARQLRAGIELDRALAALAETSPEPFETLCAIAAAKTGLDAREWAPVLDRLIEHGAFVGGLDLPSRFESPWQALEKAATELELADRALWWRAYRNLRRLCRKLSQELPHAAPDIIRAKYAEVSDVIRRLASDLGAECPPLPRVPLRCDWSLPFEVVLGPEMEERAKRALAGYLGALADFGLMDPLRDMERRRLLTEDGRLAVADADFAAQEALSAPEAGDSWQALADCLGQGKRDPAFDAVATRWESLLSTDDDRVTLPAAQAAPGPPHGCLLFGATSSLLCVHGVFDEVMPLHARFAWSKKGKRGHSDPLVDWYRAEIQELERAHGITVADLLAPCEKNPNILARPSITRAVVDPWGATPSQISLKGSEIRVDPRTRAPFLHVPSASLPLVVYALTSANVTMGDPLAQALLSTSFRLTPIVSAFQGVRVHFARELDGDKPSPEVVLPSGDVVRPRRTVVRDEELKAMTRAPAARRFVLWQREARRRRWPELVSVQRGGESAILVPRDSPLAVEAVFAGARDEHLLTIDGVYDESWLRDDDGNRYRTEFALPFVRPACTWARRRKSAPMDAAQREAREA